MTRSPQHSPNLYHFRLACPHNLMQLEKVKLKTGPVGAER